MLAIRASYYPSPSQACHISGALGWLQIPQRNPTITAGVAMMYGTKSGAGSERTGAELELPGKSSAR